MANHDESYRHVGLCSKEADRSRPSGVVERLRPARINRTGPEVIELELRLTQLGLYTRQPAGHYNEGVEDAVSRYQWARGIQGDELGVYGAETRARLESETAEP